MAIEVDPVTLRIRSDLSAMDAAIDSLLPKAKALDNTLRTIEAASKAVKDATSTAGKVAASAMADVEASAERAAKSTAKHRKEVEASTKAIEKAAQATQMAAKAELAASIAATEGTRAYETLIKVGGQYAEVLRATGDANDALVKSWRSSLSPAEKTALQIAHLEATTDEAVKKTKAYAVIIGELNLKLSDQIRRQDTNVGSQNKLSRSLSELIDELKAAQKGTLAVVVAQGQQAESADDLVGIIRNLEHSTSDAEKETEEYKATLAALQERLSGVKAASKEQADAYDKQAKKLDALEKAMGAIGLPGVAMVSSFKAINESLKEFSIISPRAAMALKAGIIAGAAVAGVGLLAAGFVSLTRSAAEMDTELRKVGLGMDKIAAQQLKNNAAAVETTGNAFKALAVTVGSIVGPAVAESAEGWTALALIIRDGYKKTLPEYAKQVADVTHKVKNQTQAEKNLAEAIRERQGLMEIAIAQGQAETEFHRGLAEQIEQEQLARLDGIERIKAEGKARKDALDEQFRELFRNSEAGAGTVERYERLKAEITATTEQQIRDEREKTSKHEQMLLDRSVEGARETIRSLQSAANDMATAITPMQVAQEKFNKAIVEMDEALESGDISLGEYNAGVTQAKADLKAAEEQAKATTAAFRGVAQEPLQFDLTVPNLEQSALGIVATVRDAFKNLDIGAVFSQVSGIASGVGGAVMGILNQVTSAATGQDLLTLVKENGAAAGKLLADGLAQTDFAGMITGLADGLVGALRALAGKPEIWQSIAEGLTEAVVTLAKNATLITDIVTSMLFAVVDNIDVLIPAFIELGVALSIGILKALPDLIFGVTEGIFRALLTIVAETLDALGLDSAADAIRGSLAGATSTGAGGLGDTGTMGTYSGTGTADRTGTGKTPIHVTDAYYPAVAGRQTLTLAPGDVADVTRGGKLGQSKRSDPALLAAMDRQTAAILEQTSMLAALRQDLLYQRHMQAASGPAGRY